MNIILGFSSQVSCYHVSYRNLSSAQSKSRHSAIKITIVHCTKGEALESTLAWVTILWTDACTSRHVAKVFTGPKGLSPEPCPLWPCISLPIDYHSACHSPVYPSPLTITLHAWVLYAIAHWLSVCMSWSYIPLFIGHYSVYQGPVSHCSLTINKYARVLYLIAHWPSVCMPGSSDYTVFLLRLWCLIFVIPIVLVISWQSYSFQDFYRDYDSSDLW